MRNVQGDQVENKLLAWLIVQSTKGATSTIAKDEEAHHIDTDNPKEKFYVSTSPHSPSKEEIS